jgi:hypothetical protein
MAVWALRQVLSLLSHDELREAGGHLVRALNQFETRRLAWKALTSYEMESVAVHILDECLQIYRLPLVQFSLSLRTLSTAHVRARISSTQHTTHALMCVQLENGFEVVPYVCRTMTHWLVQLGDYKTHSAVQSSALLLSKQLQHAATWEQKDSEHVLLAFSKVCQRMCEPFSPASLVSCARHRPLPPNCLSLSCCVVLCCVVLCCVVLCCVVLCCVVLCCVVCVTKQNRACCN